jgi:hypothetical protein
MLSYTQPLLILFTFILSFNGLRASHPVRADASVRTSDLPEELDKASGISRSISQLKISLPHVNSKDVEDVESFSTTQKASDTEDEEFVSVAPQINIPPKVSISGGMFSAFALPQSTMPYTSITLAGCICFSSLDPNTFQLNSALTRIILTNSQLNLRQFEENLGENCPNLSHIDLQGFIDVSVEGQPIITPERFAQIAHPCLLQRVLSENCKLYISHPKRSNECYLLEEMKERFLSSVLQLRSLTKAKETISMYQSVIDMLSTRVERKDLSALATAGIKAAFTAYTGM